jgi:hypothetical protein
MQAPKKSVQKGSQSKQKTNKRLAREMALLSSQKDLILAGKR